MDLTSRLQPVLAVAQETAGKVDATGEYPTETVTALRDSGLLGLTLPTEVGGLGGGPAELVDVLSSLAHACGSTAMIYLMHVSAAMTVATAPPPGQPDLLASMADGRALGTLAFSEAGSRSHFWAPVSRAARDGDALHVHARKSWVTSAGHADVYVTSTGNAEMDGKVDLFAFPSSLSGISITGQFHGLGLRGNASSPMEFDIEEASSFAVGPPGSGFDVLLGTVMPWFNLGNASVSLGLSQAVTDATLRHTSAAHLEHLDQSLSALPTIRAQLARMALELSTTRAYVEQTAARIAEPADDTVLHVLGVKAVANDAALRITETAMRVCGGAAFSQHLPIERCFRDARAGHVMAPTADVLYDFYGKAITGQPLF
jgi:alkylation response protein AidB-like acyl-CoA dehydrogenase